MAKTKLDYQFKVGDRIKLTDYTLYTDYELHKDQEATVVNVDKEAFDKKVLIVGICWDDGRTSSLFRESKFAGAHLAYGKEVDVAYEKIKRKIRKDIDDETAKRKTPTA